MIYDFTGRAKEENRHGVLEAIHAKLERGEKLTKEEQDRAVGAKGIIRHMGWCYDFTEFLKEYVVKTEYYLETTYCFNKTQAREQFKGLGKVIFITEVD